MNVKTKVTRRWGLVAGWLFVVVALCLGVAWASREFSAMASAVVAAKAAGEPSSVGVWAREEAVRRQHGEKPRMSRDYVRLTPEETSGRADPRAVGRHD